jgi:hypothetical protein
MQKTSARRFGALLVGLALVGAAACGGDDETGTTEAPSTEAPTSEAPSTEAPAEGGELEGLKGTTPLVDLSDEWKQAISDFWVAEGNEALNDWSYAAESFDAVMLIALA